MPIETIKGCFLFYQYSTPEIEEIIRLAKEQSFTAQQKIIEKGKLNDSLWILLDGRALVQDHTTQGMDINLHMLSPGEMFGEYSFVDQVPASADVVAQGLVRVIKFHFSDLSDFFSRNPQCELKTYKQMSRVMSKRLRTANRELRKSFMSSMGWELAPESDNS